MPRYTDPETGKKVVSDQPLSPEEVEASFAQLHGGLGETTSSTTTTAATGTEHPWAEGAGAFAGGLLPGPPGIIAAGVGDVLGRTAAEGRIPGVREAGKAFARGAGGQALGLGVGKAIGMGAKALGFTGKLAPEAQAAKEAASKLGVTLSAADLTGSRPVAQLENLPNYFAIGSGPVQRFRSGQLAAAGKAAGSFIDDLAKDKADTLTAGYLAKGGVTGATNAWKLQKKQLFNAVEALAGDDPVIASAPLRDQLKASPIGGVRPAIEKILAKVQKQDAISFKEARELEAEFGARGFTRAPYTGTLPQGDYKGAWSAVHGALEDWMKTPGGAGVKPELEEAKQFYSTGKSLIEDSMGKVVLGGRRRPVPAEKIIARVFRPGAITDTIDFREVVSPDVFQHSVQTALDQLYKDSHIVIAGKEVIQPSKFLRAATKLVDSGQIDVMLPPDKAAEFKSMLDVFGRLGTAEKVAGQPSGTAQGLLSVDQIIRLVTSLGGGVAGGLGAQREGRNPFVGAIGGAAIPYGIGRYVTSPGGIDALAGGLPGVLAQFGRLPLSAIGQAISQQKMPQ